MIGFLGRLHALMRVIKLSGAPAARTPPLVARRRRLVAAARQRPPEKAQSTCSISPATTITEVALAVSKLSEDMVARFSTMESRLSTIERQFGRMVLRMDRLEKTTAFRTRLEEEEKNHNFSLQQIKNTHAQKMAEISQKVRIEKQRLDAEARRYEVEMDEKVSVAESARKVKVENAKGVMEVGVTKAKGMIEVAQYQGKARRRGGGKISETLLRSQ